MGGGEKWLRSIVMLCLAAACGGRTSDRGFDGESAGTSSGGSVAGQSGSPGAAGAPQYPTPTPTPPMPSPPLGGYGGAPAPSAGTGPLPWGGLAGYFGGGAYSVGGYAGYATAGVGGGYPAGGYGGGWYSQNCDIPHGMPGCENPGVTSCVCSYDSFCCEQWWAEFCVRYFNEYCYF